MAIALFRVVPTLRDNLYPTDGRAENPSGFVRLGMSCIPQLVVLGVQVASYVEDNLYPTGRRAGNRSGYVRWGIIYIPQLNVLRVLVATYGGG